MTNAPGDGRPAGWPTAQDLAGDAPLTKVRWVIEWHTDIQAELDELHDLYLTDRPRPFDPLVLAEYLDDHQDDGHLHRRAVTFHCTIGDPPPVTPTDVGRQLRLDQDHRR